MLKTLCPALAESVCTNRVLVVAILRDGGALRRSLSIPDTRAAVELSGAAAELASSSVVAAGWLTDQHVGLLFDPLPDDFGDLLDRSARSLASAAGRSLGLDKTSLELVWTAVPC